VGSPAPLGPFPSGEAAAPSSEASSPASSSPLLRRGWRHCGSHPLLRSQLAVLLRWRVSLLVAPLLRALLCRGEPDRCSLGWCHSPGLLQFLWLRFLWRRERWVRLVHSRCLAMVMELGNLRLCRRRALISWSQALDSNSLKLLRKGLHLSTRRRKTRQGQLLPMLILPL
jgi:hypothetical protein